MRPLSTIIGVSLILLLAPPLPAQSSDSPLATATHLRCTFSLMASSRLQGDDPVAEIRDASLELEFEDVNADEGTARLASDFGTYDIIVRYAGGYLHFIQSFLDGPLHVTTILDVETADGKLKAMHSRHEYTDFALPGFTSSPEQYYGTCEIL